MPCRRDWGLDDPMVRGQEYARGIADRKPPRAVLDERGTLLQLWAYHRASLARKLEGLSEREARWSPVPSGTSLLWLVHHCARAERVWCLERLAGAALGPAQPLTSTDTVASVLADYAVAESEVRAVLEVGDLGDLTVDTGDESRVTRRWVLAHLLEETARHAGHADVLRELLDGQVGR